MTAINQYQAGFSLAYKYATRVEIFDKDEHYSLLITGIKSFSKAI
jgi:hypothetical protein